MAGQQALHHFQRALAGLKAPVLRIMRQIVNPAVIVASRQQVLRVMVQTFAAVLVAVDETMLAGHELVKPDGRGVVHAQVPKRVDRDAWRVWNASDAALSAQLLHLIQIVGTLDPASLPQST
ncbi:hypothetical protein D3C87_1548750 [compost metagenome]